jgi:hypothetical protein
VFAVVKGKEKKEGVLKELLYYLYIIEVTIHFLLENVTKKRYYFIARIMGKLHILLGHSSRRY